MLGAAPAVAAAAAAGETPVTTFSFTLVVWSVE
jgi:hypothetical protein